MQRDGGPGGAGGAGGAHGTSFTGTAQGLELYGDFAAAYSGVLAADAGTAVTVMEFTSGNYLFVGQCQLNAPVDDDDGGASGIAGATCNIQFNGATVALIAVSAVTADRHKALAVQDLIIPPYTEVKVVVTAGATAADKFSTTTLTGRIYRG